MTAISAPAPHGVAEPSFVDTIRHGVSDTWILTQRNLLRYIRIPELLIFSTVQPIMFILLFNYVFGGSISATLPGHFSYISYLVPGIITQSVVFGAMGTGAGLADDLKTGVIDRFRSLPMARSAVLGGRTMADSVRNLFVVMIMIGVGSIIGFRFHSGAIDAVAAVLMAILVALAFSWIMAFLGLKVRDAEVVQTAGFVFVFPLVFASSAFVQVQSMPGWLQAFANNQPFTQFVNAIRYPCLGTSPGGPTMDNVWIALAWIAAILAVFVPLTVRSYRKLS